MSRPWEELKLMRELGWDVTIVMASAHYLTGRIALQVRWLWRRDRQEGVTFIRTWSPKDYRRSPWSRLICYLTYSLILPLAGAGVRDVDLVFSATDPPFMTPGAYLLSRRHRARLVLDERDVYPDTAIALGMKPPRPFVAALSAWNMWLRGHAAAVVTVSPGLKELLITRGAREKDTHVLLNYFPGQEAESDAGRVDATDFESFVVLYAGSIGQITRIDTCLEAAARIKALGYDCIRFVFMGEGERRQAYMAAADKRGLNNVSFPGAVPRSDMGTVYGSAHVGIHALPSHPYWRHALSSKILEYMVHGKPVVFAGEGDIANVITESGGGIAVAYGDAIAMADAIIRLYEKPEVYSVMSANAATYVRTHVRRDTVRKEFRRALTRDRVTASDTAENRPNEAM